MVVMKSLAKRALELKYDNKSKFRLWIQRWRFTYDWDGRKYGLQLYDTANECFPEVREAIRRYRLADPYGYDQRQQRLFRYTHLAMNHEYMPKEQWTKYEDDTWYLAPFLDDIENEKLERGRTTGIKPGFQLKPQL